jgi:hypothetical protein
MKGSARYIVMADVVRSSAAPARSLMTGLGLLVARANQELGAQILSPLTVTLGDEFQGVVDGLETGVRLLIWLEEARLEVKPAFPLRYVLLRGRIATPLNPERAHGMLGPGLSRAREQLEVLKKRKRRFFIETGAGRKDPALNLAFALYHELCDSWAARDYPLIARFLRLRDYKLVAAECGRDPSSVFRRQRTLRIQAYFWIRELVECIARL